MRASDWSSRRSAWDIMDDVRGRLAATLFVVLVAYDRLAQNTGSPGDARRRLDREMQDHG